MLSSAVTGEKPTLFYSVTHLRHNYITLTHFLNLAKIAKLGFNVVIALWDMNIISNPYFRRKEIENVEYTPEKYVQKKKEEVIDLALSLGMSTVKVYNSSEIWVRFIQQRNQSLFTKYYSTLSTMDLDEHNINAKINYLIQLPADLFFANFFNYLYPEDFKEPVDVIYSGEVRKNLYFATRKAMYHEGLIDVESPLIILSKEIPRIEIDTQIPHWDMTLGELSRLFAKWHYTKDELEQLYCNVFAPVLQEVNISRSSKKLIKTVNAPEALFNLHREEVAVITAGIMFEYFKKVKELTHSKIEPVFDFLNLNSWKEAENLGTILKSKNAMKILSLSNGTRTMTEVAKSANMQLSNASQYIAKMQKAGLIKIKDKKLHRSVKGIKINFDASISQMD